MNVLITSVGLKEYIERDDDTIRLILSYSIVDGILNPEGLIGQDLSGNTYGARLIGQDPLVRTPWCPPFDRVLISALRRWREPRHHGLPLKAVVANLVEQPKSLRNCSSAPNKPAPKAKHATELGACAPKGTPASSTRGA